MSKLCDIVGKVVTQEAQSEFYQNRGGVLHWKDHDSAFGTKAKLSQTPVEVAYRP